MTLLRLCGLLGLSNVLRLCGLLRLSLLTPVLSVLLLRTLRGKARLLLIHGSLRLPLKTAAAWEEPGKCRAEE